METFQGGPDHVLGLLETLHQRNAAGHNIHIRPAPSETHGLVFLNDLSTRNIARMTRDGLEPAVTLKAAPGQYQAWVRAGEYTTAAHAHCPAPHPLGCLPGPTGTRRIPACRSAGWRASATGLRNQNRMICRLILIVGRPNPAQASAAHWPCAAAAGKPAN